MITRSHRFHGHGSLRYVYQNGQIVRSNNCALKYVKNPKHRDYRLAVVVSKKVAKSAVIRNRIRRRLYEAFRVLMPAETAYDLVLTVFHEQLANIPASELQTTMHSLLKQANITPKPTPAHKA